MILKDQIKTLNYSAHAIEELRGIAMLYKRFAPQSAIAMERLIGLLQESVKFLLPNCCDIIDPEDLKQSHIDMARLPYPCVAFESSYERQDDIVQIGDFDQSPATKRIALCWEAVPGYEIVPGLYKILDMYPEGGVFVVPIYWGPKDAKWTAALGGSFFPYNNRLRKVPIDGTLPISQIANSALMEAGLGKSNAMQYLCEPFYLFPELFDHAVEQFGSIEKAYASISIDSRDETMALIQACSVMNCANVATSEIHASSALNKKRTANGKQPFFTYKVLEITEERKETKKGVGGLDHSSPRMHLRRGHLRRLENKAVWVRPALINAESTSGAVFKDYAIKGMIKGDEVILK